MVARTANMTTIIDTEAMICSIVDKSDVIVLWKDTSSVRKAACVLLENNKQHEWLGVSFCVRIDKHVHIQVRRRVDDVDGSRVICERRRIDVLEDRGLELTHLVV